MFRNMSEEKFNYYCRNKGLDENEILLAKLILIDGLRGQDLYDAHFWSPAYIKMKRQIIFAKLGVLQP